MQISECLKCMLMIVCSFLISVLLFSSLQICSLVLSVLNVRPQSLFCLSSPFFFVISLLSHNITFFIDIWIVSLSILKCITEYFSNAGDVSHYSSFGRLIILNGLSLWLVAPSSLLICNLVLGVTRAPHAP